MRTPSLLCNQRLRHTTLNYSECRNAAPVGATSNELLHFTAHCCVLLRCCSGCVSGQPVFPGACLPYLKYFNKLVDYPYPDG